MAISECNQLQVDTVLRCIGYQFHLPRIRADFESSGTERDAAHIALGGDSTHAAHEVLGSHSLESSACLPPDRIPARPAYSQGGVVATGVEFVHGVWLRRIAWRGGDCKRRLLANANERGKVGTAHLVKISQRAFRIARLRGVLGGVSESKPRGERRTTWRARQVAKSRQLVSQQENRGQMRQGEKGRRLRDRARYLLGEICNSTRLHVGHRNIRRSLMFTQGPKATASRRQGGREKGSEVTEGDSEREAKRSSFGISANLSEQPKLPKLISSLGIHVEAEMQKHPTRGYFTLRLGLVTLLPPHPTPRASPNPQAPNQAELHLDAIYAILWWRAAGVEPNCHPQPSLGDFVQQSASAEGANKSALTTAEAMVPPYKGEKRRGNM
ncbi:hypothetical protein K438DRAFT_1771801 [Mycena galopus ATCC 62051]|nr:hypothetical protein K438DRAFT_1771801 [Mycena galopus ATCC 62051]